MKVLLMVVTLALITAALPVSSGSTQIRLNGSEGLLAQSIDNVDLEASNIGLLLSRFSAQTKIPIGLEVSPYDDLSIVKTSRLKIKHATLRDALESIVKQNPLYTWKVQNEVVNVLPTEANRDELLRDVLETKLEKFSIQAGMRRFTLRQALSTNPAVESVLAQQNVRPVNQSFMSRDFAPLGGDYVLEASNVSVSELLNKVIRDSQTKYWIVFRYGKQKQYFVLNL